MEHSVWASSTVTFQLVFVIQSPVTFPPVALEAAFGVGTYAQSPCWVLGCGAGLTRAAAVWCCWELHMVSAKKLLGQAQRGWSDESPSLGQLVELCGLEVPVWSSRSSQEKAAVHRIPWLRYETYVFWQVVLGCRNKPSLERNCQKQILGRGPISCGSVGLAQQQATGTSQVQCWYWLGFKR